MNDPKVESAFYDWKGAVEGITTARSLPDPMLNFDVEITNDMWALTNSLITDPMTNWPGPGKLSLRSEAALPRCPDETSMFEAEMLTTALSVKRAYTSCGSCRRQIRWTGKA